MIRAITRFIELKFYSSTADSTFKNCYEQENKTKMLVHNSKRECHFDTDSSESYNPNVTACYLSSPESGTFAPFKQNY